MKYRLAADIGASRTMFALIAADSARVVAHDRVDTDVVFGGDRPAGESLARAIRRFLDQRQLGLGRIVGVGLGVPGLVRQHAGRVLACPNLRMLDATDLGPETSAQLGVPVFVDNNTNLIALGEHTAGIGQGIDDLAVVFVGSGVGCGLILNGRLYHGADGLAAELGHTIVVPDGLQCSCGGRGCVEMYCSGKALTLAAEEIFAPRELFRLGTRFAGARLVIEQALAGHERARQVMVKAFTHLGYALANLAVLLSPRMIVLGGGVVKAWPEGIAVATEIVRRDGTVEVPRDLLVVRSKLEDFAGVIGGATLVGQELGLLGASAQPTSNGRNDGMARIARLRTNEGDIIHGLVDDEGSTARVVEGCIYDAWRATDAKVLLAECRLLAPVEPPNILAIGLNYRAHAKESGHELPSRPVLFMKATTALLNPGDPIILPRVAPAEVDYECELAIVIGRTARHVGVTEASDYVLGYTCANDVSARDVQLRQDGQWVRGKSFDTFAPLGPWIQTDLDTDSVRICTRLNGTVMQDSSTSDLIFSCAELISYLSDCMTLLPGTVIMTGTPSGVGFARNPPIFLRPGDIVEIEVDGIGVLRNPVVSED